MINSPIANGKKHERLFSGEKKEIKHINTRRENLIIKEMKM